MLLAMSFLLGCGGPSAEPVTASAPPSVGIKVNCGPGLQLKTGQDGLQQWCERDDGLMHGPFLELYPDGTRQRLGRYDNGQADDEWIWWHENGQQAQTGKYVKGKKTGSWTWWYPNGNRSEAGDYLQNRKAGQWTTWYDTGNRKEEGLYHNGLRVGTWTTFNDDAGSSVAKTEVYANDTVVEVNGVKVTNPTPTPAQKN